LVTIEQRFQLLLSLPLADLLWVALFEELWSDFKEPFGIDGTDFPHVLLGCLNKLVIDHPLWSFVKQ